MLWPISEGKNLYEVLTNQDGDEEVLNVFQYLLLIIRHITFKE